HSEIIYREFIMNMILQAIGKRRIAKMLNLTYGIFSLSALADLGIKTGPGVCIDASDNIHVAFI
ncbi:MAG: hypothetical protein LHW56_01465, partial [Candidatus Cloacimonetes bacterium]|nr:hypothetical protein [Candidatus Cloacimonadota bacterium]MDY0171555.1 hypothetical protein [Candidatus Cloacimonadaceae bacterium]